MQQIQTVAALILLALATAVHADPDLARLIDDAVRVGQSRLVLPTGPLRVDAAGDRGVYHLNLKVAKNLEIVGDHTTLLFTQPRTGGIQLTDCQNVTLRDVTLDWDPLPSTQGRISKLDPDAGTIMVAVDKGFSDDPALFARSCGAILYDADTRQLKRNAWELFGLTITRDAPGVVSLKCKTGGQLKGAGAAVGDLVAVRQMSGEVGIRLVNCSNVTLQNVTILSAPGMAIQEVGGEGSNRYTVTVTRGPDRDGTPRLLSSNADALHSSGVRRGPTISNSRLEYQGDDGVAIHGAYCLVAGDQDGALLLSPKYDMPLRAGDRVRLYDGKTFAGKGEAAVASIGTTRPADAVIAAMEPIWKAYRGDAGKAKYSAAKLDPPLAAKPGDLLASPDRLGSGFAIRNCTIGHHRARGINVKACSGVIDNNTIEDTGGAGIAIGPEFAYWLESDYARDLVIRNNTLRNVGTSAAVVRHDKAIAVGAISIYALTPDHDLPPGRDNANLTIAHNTIDGCGGIGMLIACARNVDVQDNTVRNTQFLGKLLGGQKFGVDPDAAVFVEEADDVRFDRNTLSGKGVVWRK